MGKIRVGGLVLLALGFCAACASDGGQASSTTTVPQPVQALMFHTVEANGLSVRIVKVEKGAGTLVYYNVENTSPTAQTFKSAEWSGIDANGEIHAAKPQPAQSLIPGGLTQSLVLIPGVWPDRPGGRLEWHRGQQTFRWNLKPYDEANP